VRLRFVAPGEDFLFARDAQVVDVEAASRRGRGLVILGAIALVAVVAVVVIVKAIGGRGGDEGSRGGDSQSQVFKLNAEIDKALKAEDWDEAIAKAAEGLKLDPTQEVLRDKKSRAEGEKKNKTIYDRYQSAAQRNDYEEAVTRYQELPDTSGYHEKAQESWGPIKTAYIKDHLAKARTLQGASRCEEARKHVESVLFIEEGNGEAQEIAQRCGQPQVKRPTPPRPATPRAPAVGAPPATPRPKEASREPAERPHEPPAPESAPSASSANVDQTVGEAQDDYVHGNYAEAIEKARKALKQSAGNAKAWRIIGASSCFLKDKGGAVSAWNKLGPMDRQFLKYVCQRNTITIP
jgi:tetratricopeptide (TPR) repeat protein